MAIFEQVDPMPNHIVDTLIAERSGRFGSHPALWAATKVVLYPLLKYRQAVGLTDQIRAMDAQDIFEFTRDLLKLNVDISGSENIPKKGRFILATNHPTLADMFPIYDALRSVRPDFTLIATKDAVRVAQNLLDLLIPVDVDAAAQDRHTSRQVLRRVMKTFKDERALIIFPSGGLARLRNGQLREQQWHPTPINLARKFDAPILPLHISGKNSWLYYFFGKISRELRDMTVFYEILNKERATYRLTFGPLINPGDIPSESLPAISKLQSYVEDDLPSLRRSHQFPQALPAKRSTLF